MSIEGALLKLSHGLGELAVRSGATFAVPLRVARSPKLSEKIRLELIVPRELSGLIGAEPIDLLAGRRAVNTGSGSKPRPNSITKGSCHLGAAWAREAPDLALLPMVGLPW